MSLKLRDLKKETTQEMLIYAEETGVEDASSMRTQDMLFEILRSLASNKKDIDGEGVLEVLQDGFGFLRSMEANYLPGPDDIYVSPSQIKRFGLRSGDTVEGPIRAPKEGERYFALLKIDTINYEATEKSRNKINFDNLTPLYPDEQIKLETEDFYNITKRILETSKKYCNGKVVSILEGGYDLQALKDSSKRHVDALIEFV